MEMNLILICAMGEDFSIGKDNTLLWHLPADFTHFKALTTGHSIIMGRKTFESLPKMLPNRRHIIISRQMDYTIEDAIVVASIEEALECVKNEEKAFVIGGGEIYRLAMPYANTLEITRVHSKFNADTFFPEIDPTLWQCTQKIFHPKDEKHLFDFTFETYQRII